MFKFVFYKHKFEEFGGCCPALTESDMQLSPQSVFLCVGLCMGGCPEGRGTWNIKPCHGGSAQLWALSCSGSLPGVEVAAGVAQVWKKDPQLAPLHSSGTRNPLPVWVDGNVFVTLFLESRTPQKGKLAFAAFVWRPSSRTESNTNYKRSGRWMQMTVLCSTAGQPFMTVPLKILN